MVPSNVFAQLLTEINNPQTLEIGTALSEAGNYEKTIQYHDKALATDPNMPDALCNKGLVVEKKQLTKIFGKIELI